MLVHALSPCAGASPAGKLAGAHRTPIFCLRAAHKLFRAEPLISSRGNGNARGQETQTCDGEIFGVRLEASAFTRRYTSHETPFFTGFSEEEFFQVFHLPAGIRCWTACRPLASTSDQARLPA